jgi:hypothetical protein
MPKTGVSEIYRREGTARVKSDAVVAKLEANPEFKKLSPRAQEIARGRATRTLRGDPWEESTARKKYIEGVMGRVSSRANRKGPEGRVAPIGSVDHPKVDVKYRGEGSPNVGEQTIRKPRWFEKKEEVSRIKKRLTEEKL